MNDEITALIDNKTRYLKLSPAQRIFSSSSSPLELKAFSDFD